MPAEVTDADMKVLETYVVPLYSRTLATSLKNNPSLPCPSEWGWIVDNEGKWSYLPEASQECRELISLPAKYVALKYVIVIKPISRVHSSASLVVDRHVE